MSAETLTSDGYPTEGALTRIEAWDLPDLAGWMAFIRSCWWMVDWGWTEFDGVDDFGRKTRTYHISTGGWSGNESVIAAMRANKNYLWMFTAQAWRRGGHYEFRVDLTINAPASERSTRGDP